ncbi:MAG: hypothetical protein DDT19_02630 [Syntrophomonadaceae bacterium]|nr:hypothetical protein [Bacillota bacterium]
MLESRALILARVEPAYGVDAQPTPAADAIRTTKPTIELIEESRERDVVLPHFGSLASIPVATGIKIAFGVEVRGSGITPPSTPPRLGALLRACGFTQTVTTTLGAERVDYDPHSAMDGESVTIYFHHDGILYRALGCVGTSVKLSAKANDIAKFDFEFTGMFGGFANFVLAHAFPAPIAGDAAVPSVFRSGAFSFGGLHAAAAIVDAIEVTRVNTVAKRGSVNAISGVHRYSFAGREISGSFDPEIPPLVTWNPWHMWETAITGALSMTIGTVAGNRLSISMPNCQIDAPKLGAREGIQTYAISFKARTGLAAGNNEIQLRFN